MIRGLVAATRQPRVLRRTGHRPWPVPGRPWLMAQTWSDLLFAHWRVDPDELRGVLHPGLPLDTFDGSAWIGVTPFRVEGFRLRHTAPLPLVHAFPELNVRTYVTIDDRPGIHFFSLDAGSRFAVESARRIYRLPYFHARMAIRGRGDEIDFASERTQSDGPPARLAVGYEAAGPAFEPAPGSLEHFLTERYCLYTLDESQRVLRGDIHHPPWRVRPARARVRANTMASQIGLDLRDKPLAHFAERQDVVFWTLRPVA
jgi:uncharacterized protein YqjF (DUF2071 family)